MRNRWTPRILLGIAITLSACAPQQGIDASDEPSQAPASISPATPEPSERATGSPGASESAAPDPTPPDYDY